MSESERGGGVTLLGRGAERTSWSFAASIAIYLLSRASVSTEPMLGDLDPHSVCVRERERERECVCVRERERERECVCV